MPYRVHPGPIQANDLELQRAAADRSKIYKSHWKSRLIINIVTGCVIMTGVFVALLLFVVIPQMNQAKPENQQQTMFPNNRQHRYDWLGPSYSLMGKFKRAAVTCDHGLCTEMGRDIMLKGGNAVDASIASLFCLGVTNPQSSGLGGGFIMTLYNRTTKSCKVVDARETAPKASSRDMYGSDEWASKYGYRAIATPGELAGYWLAFKEFGSGRVSWTELVMPSVHLARSGVPVSEYLAHVLQVKENHFRTLPSMQGWINNVTNHVYQFGDVIHRLELADTMEKIALSPDPIKLFYHGEMADTIVSEIQQNGGLLTKEDLANYKPKVYERPLISDGFFEDLRMCGPPPPSSFAVMQSIVAVMVSRFSDHERKGNPMSAVYDDTAFYHWMIEAQKFAYSQRTRLGDVDFVPESLELARNMSSREYTKAILKKIPPHAMFTSYYSEDLMAHKEDHGTSHVSVIDAEGNAVSATSTVNRWFGAVVQSDKLGIIWNDEMDDFSTPGMANGFGFAPSPTNFIEPGKRPMSSMSPAVIYDGKTGNVKFSIGASGGSKIISAMAKPIIRVLCFNETIKEAIDAPTLHNQFTPDITQFEDTVPKQLLMDLEEKFQQKFKPTTGFEGIVQGIYAADDGFLYANGDYRRRSWQSPGGF
ncbi:gamma-glutamyltranspeptidase domain-containing protein [Ditylenchus destructor]|uniref:Gamma-glutamyltranspeptidase domain-containing protein n=1 Tax=Ditylenchus destructor TaxID=166010 RepID=A0AAD4R4A6_9BILA|nr:gamma-glutamyltranspeptidase domain-containing protein [Ditylenchus destructor]